MLDQGLTKFRRLWAVAAVAAGVCFGPLARAEEAADHKPEQLPPGRTVVRIEALPATVQLKHPYDYAQLLLSAELDSGERIDVTRLAQAEAPSGVVSLSP